MAQAEPPTYHVWDIEAKARDLLRTCFGEHTPIPVDVDFLVESQPGVQLDYMRGLRDGHGVEGMVLRDVDSGELLIYIDESLADAQRNRYRTTVAEEFGHLILHRQQIDAINSPEAFRALQQHSCWHTMERNAKRFAAAVLMPPGAVIAESEQLYPQLVGVVGYDNPAAVKKQLATSLARRFEVSTGSMEYRLDESGVKVNRRVDEALKYRLDYLP